MVSSDEDAVNTGSAAAAAASIEADANVDDVLARVTYTVEDVADVEVEPADWSPAVLSKQVPDSALDSEGTANGASVPAPAQGTSDVDEALVDVATSSKIGSASMVTAKLTSLAKEVAGT